MISFNEVGAMLDAIAEELPEDFYKELNGGILLLPDTKLHPASKKNIHGNQPTINELYILGEYHNERAGYGGLGRYIVIYYGSFVKVHGNLLPQQQKEELKKVLIHEFTHHMESLAGERGLELKDDLRIEKYKRRFM